MTPFAGIAWRAVFAGSDPLSLARSPVGRFHHSGQTALYTSLSAEGCAVAIRQYVQPSDPPRVIVPLTVSARHLADLRGRPDVSVVWQDDWAKGIPSSTWAFSDAARADGAQGLLYSSRSRPDLTHLVLFDLSTIRTAGDALPFPS